MSTFNKQLYTLGIQGVMEQYLSHFFELHGDILPAEGLYHCFLKEIEKPLIEITLKRLKGNKVKTAQLLGINRNTLHRKMQELDIHMDEISRDFS